MGKLNPVEIIIEKRDGGTHLPERIRAFVDSYVAGDVADYQMSAWLMASYLNGLCDAEAVALTEAMLHSGDVLRLASVKAKKVDKHSTGGVGDKISICLAPLVAACGVAVPMISGRGLGHTGGTLDKLESFPGYSVDIDSKKFERIVREVGVAMIGQTARLAPADRKIYALRDVTGTVECIPLIVASILSKKLAEGIDALVLDVKVGRGAFMKDLASARELARALVRVGTRAGKKVVALLTDMSVPIGRTIGNALESREAVEVLKGQGPRDTTELTLALGAEMLVLGGAAKSVGDARKKLQAAIDNGAGLDRLARMIEAQSGDPRAVEDPSRLARAKHRVVVTARATGVVTACDALELGLTSVALGAGRTRADQKIDPAVGIELAKKPGERVEKGEPLAWLHVQKTAGMEPLVARAEAAFSIGKRTPKVTELVLERIAPRRG